MNNNRGNNRRRGRGNNNRPQQGGGQPVNRIDSRARGNAPQMLEKYRKLAHDAHLNGDRVNAEYYLQFADHYFRVIADTRTRAEEARNRNDNRWQDPADSYREEADDGSEEGAGSDFPTFDQPPVYTRVPREDRPAREDRGPRMEQSGSEDAAGDDRGDEPAGDPGEPGSELGGNPYEPVENPFLRENRGGNERGTRGLRPRREDRRPRHDEASGGLAGVADGPAAGSVSAPAGLDPTSLPPSISAVRRGEGEGVEAAAQPKRRARRKPVGDAGEALETAG